VFLLCVFFSIAMKRFEYRASERLSLRYQAALLKQNNINRSSVCGLYAKLEAKFCSKSRIRIWSDVIPFHSSWCFVWKEGKASEYKLRNIFNTFICGRRIL
jgi:hypothetical protein